MSSKTPLVALESVSKTFGSTRALKEVSFDVLPGEVHVLAGENGAGKSTLIRIVAGALSEFEGRLVVQGRPARFRMPIDATRAGIATIHQELSLVGSMSVLDNLFLGEPAALFERYSAANRVESARRLLATLELDIDPYAPVESLPLSLRQLVEIARALAQDAQVLVMDEPTSALSEPEAERLFSHVRRLREEGRGIVYISHRMEEIFQLADRITVLRDGARVLTASVGQLDEDELVSAMVGRELTPAAEPARARSEASLLQVRGLSLEAARGGRKLLDGISFTLHPGEVLGIAGLQGAGTSELLRAIYGCYGKRARGELSLGGAPFVPEDPRQSVAQGVVLLASDRRATVLPAMSVRANATLSSLVRFTTAGFVRSKTERAAVSALTGDLALTTPSLDALAGALSGGNQQKVAFARCLLAKPRLLLLDDPTRGIDVAAKADVQALVRRLAAEQTGVLLVASELDELLALSDRVLVLVSGKVQALLDRSELDRAQLLSWCMGREGAAA